MELSNKPHKASTQKNGASVEEQNRASISITPSSVGLSLHCAVRGCIFSRPDMVTSQVRFFGSPQCENLLRTWKRACGYIIEDTFNVCDRHFAPSDFIRRYDVLNLKAVPSLHLDPLGVKPYPLATEQRKPTAVCAVRGCIYSQAGSAPKHVRFFPAPHCDDSLRSSWKQVCGFVNGSFFTVCERHFKHGDFITRHNSLKRKAVPSLHLGPNDMGSPCKRHTGLTSAEDLGKEIVEDRDCTDEEPRVQFIKTEHEYIDTSPEHCGGFEDSDGFHTEFHEILPDSSPRSNAYAESCIDPLFETKPTTTSILQTDRTAPCLDELANRFSDDCSNSSVLPNIKEEEIDQEEPFHHYDELPTQPPGVRPSTTLWDSGREIDPCNFVKQSETVERDDASSSRSPCETRESSSESDSEGVAPIFSQKDIIKREEITRDAEKVCGVRGCVNSRSGSILPFIRLYPSPRFKPDLYAWNTACGYHPSEFRDSFKVCGRHFKSSDFRVKDGALKHRTVPSLLLNSVVPPGDMTEFDETRQDHEGPRSACAVRNCLNSRVSLKPAEFVLHPAPELKSVRDMWKYHCGYRPHEIGDSFSVCSLHFSPADFQKRDGILKPKAVPALHSDSPDLEEL